MRIRRIEVFVAVAENGSFSAAAAKLNIAQSAVSVAIKELERDLGTRLFHRDRRQVELSETGRLLRDRALPAMRLLKLAKDEIKDVEDLAAGRVQIGAPAMVTQFGLSPILPRFLSKHPGIRLRVKQVGALEVEQHLVSGDIDLGISVNEIADRSVETAPLWRFENVACVPNHDPGSRSGEITWPALLSRPLAAYPRGYHQRELVERMATKYSVTPHLVVESENPSILLAAVAAQEAVTTLPLPAMQGVKGLAALRLPVNEGGRLDVTLCWSSERPLSKAAGAMCEFLRSHAAQGARAFAN